MPTFGQRPFYSVLVTAKQPLPLALRPENSPMAQRFSFRQRPRRGRYFVYVVVVPANWEPIGWHDRPKLAQEVELAGCFSRRMTRGLMQDFNRSELDARRRRNGKNLWMIADAVEGGVA